MDANIAVTQFTSAAVVVWGMQQIKAASWFPWITEKSAKWGKRVVSIAAAIGTHTGISHVWNPGPVPGSHVLMLTIPPLAVIAVALWHWLQQFVLQEVIYQATGNRAAPRPAG